MGDWSVQQRPEGTLQWTLRGAPLYSYAEDAHVGDNGGDGAEAGLALHRVDLLPISRHCLHSDFLPAAQFHQRLPGLGGFCRVNHIAW